MRSFLSNCKYKMAFSFANYLCIKFIIMRSIVKRCVFFLVQISAFTSKKKRVGEEKKYFTFWQQTFNFSYRFLLSFRDIDRDKYFRSTISTYLRRFDFDFDLPIYLFINILMLFLGNKDIAKHCNQQQPHNMRGWHLIDLISCTSGCKQNYDSNP